MKRQTGVTGTEPLVIEGVVGGTPIPVAGSFSIAGPVDQGNAGTQSWKVVEDNSAAILAALGGSVTVFDYHKVATSGNNAAVVKNASGKVHKISVFNNANYPIYIKLFNKATAPDPTSDTVIRTTGVQSGLRADDSTTISFSTGIGIAIVKGISDTDNTSVVANDCVVDIDYE